MEMNNFPEDQIAKLAEKCNLLQIALERCLGIALTSDLPPRSNDSAQREIISNSLNRED